MKFGSILLFGAIGVSVGACAIVVDYDFEKYGPRPEGTGGGGDGGSGGMVASVGSTGSTGSTGTGGMGGQGGQGGGGPIGTVLAEGLRRPWAIAADQGAIYWSTAQALDTTATVSSLGKDGTNLKILANGQEQVEAIAVDSDRVYWVDNTFGKGTLRSSSKLSGTVSLMFNSMVYVLGVAAQGGHFYWTEYDNDYIYYQATPGATPMAIVTGSDTDGPAAVTADASGLYWLDKTNVMKAGLDGSTPAVLGNMAESGSAGTSNPIALDATHVFWCTSTGDVYRVAKDGASGPEKLASGNTKPCLGVASDGAYVYYTTDTSVMAKALGGGMPIELGSGYKGPARIVVDATDVYFTVQGDFQMPNGMVVKLPKMP